MLEMLLQTDSVKLLILLPKLPSLNETISKARANRYAAAKDTEQWVQIGKVAALQAMPSDWQPFAQTKLTFIVYRKNFGVFDIVNLAVKPIIDGFKQAGLIVDDNFKYVPEVTIKFGGVDRDNPHVMCLVESASL